MPDLDDVCRIVRTLPGATESEDGYDFSVLCKGKLKKFAGVWRERVDPKKSRVPNESALVVRTANVDEKAALIESDPGVYFTDPHHHGWPAVILRLDKISMAELKKRLAAGWRCHAPKELSEKTSVRAKRTTKEKRR
jgi:hypothetical protein